MVDLDGLCYNPIRVSFKHNHQSNGFNLLEVIIAGFIFSVVSIAFLGVWGIQIRSMEKSRHHLVATHLAEHTIESIMSDGYQRTPVTTDESGPRTEMIEMDTHQKRPSGDWVTTQAIYRSEVQVEQIPIGGENDLIKRVIVTITWEDASHSGDITLATYLAGVQ